MRCYYLDDGDGANAEVRARVQQLADACPEEGWSGITEQGFVPQALIKAKAAGTVWDTIIGRECGFGGGKSLSRLLEGFPGLVGKA